MIARDGAAISVWQNDMTPYASLYENLPSRHYDVAIIGGGITGISTALMLQQQGLRCVVLEAGNIGFGTTGGTTAHLNTLLDTSYKQLIRDFGLDNARLVAGAAEAAIALITEYVDRYNIDCGLRYTNAYLMAQDEKEVRELESLRKACDEVGLRTRFINAGDRRLPQIVSMEVAGQACFHPLRYLYGIANAFESDGGVICQGTRVTNVAHIGEGGITLETAEAGNFTATKVVYATHTPTGINLLHLRCIPYRSYAIAVRLQSGQYPDGLYYDMKDPYNYYRSQQINGLDYLVAGGRDHRTGDDINTERQFLELEAHVRQHFDVAELAWKWSSQYYEPADGLPYIGVLPGADDRFYVAAGFSGNGMIYSSIAATLLTKIIMQQPCAYEALFSPSRIKPVAGFTNFISHNAHVAGNLLRKLWSPVQLQQLAELAPGEGRVVAYEGHNIALYKDDKGALHALKSTCTHMGCSVQWNAAERSWDCPCHGARFDQDGHPLTAPAVAGLQQVDMAAGQTDK